MERERERERERVEVRRKRTVSEKRQSGEEVDKIISTDRASGPTTEFIIAASSEASGALTVACA